MPDYRLQISPVAEPPGRKRQSLATSFRDVDSSGDTGACQQCLDLLSDIPFFHEIKTETFRIIAGACPARVLDAGCGTGTDVLSLCSFLPAQCQIVGLDASGVLLSRAAERTAAMAERCPLIRGDVTAIPCPEGTFGACRVDRVLQHIMEPDRAVRELARVLHPGGTLVAFDNDWDTFRLRLDDQSLETRICRFWRDSFAAGRIGRALPELFQQCGLTGIHTKPCTLTLADGALAEKVFDIPVLLGRTVAAGILTPQESAKVQDELHRRSVDGTFLSGYTAFLVWGRKPV